MHIVLCIFLAFFVSGCSSSQYARGTDANMARLDNTWESNLRIIKAAEASGSVDVALNTALKEIQTRPKNDEARIVAARMHTRKGQPKQATALLEELANPDSAEAHLEKGRALLAQSKIPETGVELKAAMDSKPSPAVEREVMKLQAICLDLAGKHADAQSLYSDLLSEKDEASVRFNFGRSLYESRKYSDAVSVLMPIVEVPLLPQARLVAAAAMVKNNDRQSARSLLEGHVAASEIDKLVGGSRL